jgi:hypothetical protein
MRSERAALLAVAALALGLALTLSACANSKSFVVLHLKTDSADVTFTGVEKIVVAVSQTSTLTSTLTYDGHGLTIDSKTDNTLSINFSPEQSGVVTLDVQAVGANGCLVARANTTAIIRKGGTASVMAVFYEENSCLTDGGLPPPDGATFPGCDPASPACPAGNTCQVNCKATPKKVAECIAGGKGGHGAACATNADCAPGSQCFKYASPGCAVSVCLRFCDGQNQCAQPAGDGGAGPGTRSLCAGPVQCESLLTSYHTCTFACDPRESALAAKATLCPAGLSCLVVGDMDQVDCACPEQSRVGTDGADCTGGAQCAPGYICNLMAGAKKCRALCRCDAEAGTCTAPNDCRSPGKACNALTNDTMFGVCL